MASCTKPVVLSGHKTCIQLLLLRCPLHCQGKQYPSVHIAWLAQSLGIHTWGLGLQTALACFEAKKKLLQQARILKDAFIITAQEPLPDDLVTAVQVNSL